MEFNKDYAEIAVALPVTGTFTYSVPIDLIELMAPGKRVLVPFGRRRVTGYILGPAEKPEKFRLKPILDILDENPLFHESMIPFFKWISDYYIHPIGEVIQGALPAGLNEHDTVSVSLTQTGKELLSGEAALSPKNEILTHLGNGPIRMKDLCSAIGRKISFSSIRALEKNGWVSCERVMVRPVTKPLTEKHVRLISPDIPDDRHFAKRKRVINILEKGGTISLTELKKQASGSAGAIGYLEKNGNIAIDTKRVFRDPLGEPVRPDNPPELTGEQEEAVSRIANSLKNGFSVFILAGVTGSGKTEVYMRLADAVIRGGQTVLVMVPEIALISQTERRFRARFGECVAVMHSGLSSGERYDQWLRIVNGGASIVIGARSAVFAPLKNIGIIVVDEEHDTSYKQETKLKYNARDLAAVRGKFSKCVVVMGSATPSVQSSFNAAKGKFIEVVLKNRVGDRPLPDVSVVDLKMVKDLRGVKRFFTAELHDAMKETLGRGEQVLLFLNRRGYATFPVCNSCGESVHCVNCDITLTLHRDENLCKCHYCGYMCPPISICPSCQSSGIRFLGFGTEKLESAVRSLFPDARIARMDRDTTRRKGAIVKILRDLKRKHIDILIGTQMVTKGHDFPDITLVGVVCADLSLGFPDFRSGERTFQLLAQVSGRAGRGSAPGRVIMQTFNPDHYSVVSAKHQDSRTFYEKEIGYRQTLGYPPFSRLIQLKISGGDQTKVREIARTLGDICKMEIRKDRSYGGSIQILGPVEAPISKIANRHRWQILVKCPHVKTLHRFVKNLMSGNAPIFANPAAKIEIDVDPYYML